MLVGEQLFHERKITRKTPSIMIAIGTLPMAIEIVQLDEQQLAEKFGPRFQFDLFQIILERWLLACEHRLFKLIADFFPAQKRLLFDASMAQSSGFPSWDTSALHN